MAEILTLENPSSSETIWATGRRKTSVASARVVAGGEGGLEINGKSLEEFFGGHLRQKLEIGEILKLTQPFKDKNFILRVSGGGVSGQAGAIRHAIARALLKLDPNLKAALRKEGFLTRDDRMVERKKPGQPGARKRYQYSKR